MENIEAFRKAMTDWYKAYGRDLPWRRTKNPYNIWISEIMLQQTQVDTVKSYYERFIAAFPDTKTLVDAPDDAVFKLWEGLGYYRRAKHLKAAAAYIEEECGGIFPDAYETLLKLKGVGSYTASAIASIAYGIPKGVVDGNALRIISRLYNRQDNIALDKTKKEYQDIMDRLIENTDASDFNQAMMDLGAMVCTPKKPDCKNCPAAPFCEARKADTAAILPVNIKKRSKAEFDYITAVLKYKNQYMLVKNKDGLLENLYGFIQYDVWSPAAFEDAFEEEYGAAVRLTDYVKEVKHVFTHKIWRMNVYLGILYENPGDEYLYTESELMALPISTAHKKAMRAADISGMS